MMPDTLVADANHTMRLIDPEIIYRFEAERALEGLRFDPVTVDINLQYACFSSECFKY